MPPPGPDADRRGRDVLVVLRLTADTNRKNRPDWYDKRTCVRSVLRSAEALRRRGVRVHLLCLVDRAGGALPGALQAEAAAWDEVVEIDGGSARRSWQAMLDHLRGRRDLPHDLVYLVEDDHLHAPDALTALSEQGEGCFLLYTHRFTGPPRRTGDHDWRPVDSGVSSFAMSRREFDRSFRVLRTMSNANQSWDDLTWHVLLGPRHFTARYLLEAFSSDFGFPPWSPRTLYNLVWRSIGFVWARLRRPSAAWGADPNLATHVETAHLAGGRDWSEVSARVLTG